MVSRGNCISSPHTLSVAGLRVWQFQQLHGRGMVDTSGRSCYPSTFSGKKLVVQGGTEWRGIPAGVMVTELQGEGGVSVAFCACCNAGLPYPLLMAHRVNSSPSFSSATVIMKRLHYAPIQLRELCWAYQGKWTPARSSPSSLTGRPALP